MSKKKLVYDEFMSWPYIEAYGMVPAPKVKNVSRKRRKSRAKPDWLELAHSPGIALADELGQASSRVKRKVAKALLREVTDGTPRKRRSPKSKLVEQAHAEVRTTPLLENPPEGFAKTFKRGALT